MKKRNSLISLFAIPVVTFCVMMPAIMIIAPHQDKQPKQEKTSLVDRAFDAYFEKEMGCSVEEFTSELTK